MRPASYPHSSYAQRMSVRRRAAAIVLAIAANILLILMLLGMAPAILHRPPADPDPKSFQLLPESPIAAKAPRTVAKTSRAGRAPTPRPADVPPTPPLNMVVLSKADFAASDIAKLRSHSQDQALGDGSADDGKNASADGKGEGPGGARLYEAKWYREPTHAELATYLPANGTRTGWGIIACQTVERYHVDNCRELGDSPPGSGMAGAIRQAAWQFLVWPPRLDGRPLIGAWVRIRIDVTPSGVK